MKRYSVVPAFLAAVLVASIAFAARDRITAPFISQATSGVSGQATLSSMPQGGTMIRGQVRGLQPNVEYVSQYFTDGACTATPGNEIARFKANPAGLAVFNARIEAPITEVHSVSIQLASDLALQACASVSQ